MFLLEYFKLKFKDIPEKSMDSFINLATEVKFKKNETITRTGDISKDFFIIKSGIVRSFYADEKGKEYTRSIFVAGSTTGSLGSLISGESSKLNYECLSDCVLYKFVCFCCAIKSNSKRDLFKIEKINTSINICKYFYRNNYLNLNNNDFKSPSYL